MFNAQWAFGHFLFKLSQSESRQEGCHGVSILLSMTACSLQETEDPFLRLRECIRRAGPTQRSNRFGSLGCSSPSLYMYVVRFHLSTCPDVAFKSSRTVSNVPSFSSTARTVFSGVLYVTFMHRRVDCTADDHSQRRVGTSRPGALDW